jgi:FMN phosphatase YigB (HAD superfamily)
MRGKYTAEVFSKKIAKDTKLETEYVLGELIKSTEDMKFDSEEVLNQIQEIRQKGVKVIVATDNMDTFIRWTVPSLKLNKLFDGVLNSWELKALKGDFDRRTSRFFDNFFKNINLATTDCVLFDDSEDKENRIQNYGIEYVQISGSEDLCKLKNI